MPVELRKTGISVVGDAPWGSHFCHFYETKQDLLDTLVPYFKAGLESREYCLWVVSNPEITVEEAKAALEVAVPDLDQRLSVANVEILSAPDWYLQDNVFNLERVTSAWDARLARALALGYDGMRVSGDTFWLREKDKKDFCAYEKQLNDSIGDRPMTVLCTYPLEKSGAAEVLDVVQTHQVAIARRRGRWEIIETPDLTQARADVKRLNEELAERVADRTRELVAANEALTREIAERRRVEGELLERAADLAEAQRVAKIGNWVLNLRTRTLTWSDELYRLFEIDKADFDNRYESFVTRIHPADRVRVVRANAQTRIKGSAFDIEYRIVTATGEVKDIREVGYAAQDEAGTVMRLFGTAQDITERKQAESLLRAKEQEFRAIVENVPDQIVRYDREFRRTYVNPAVASAYGLPAEALTGTPIGAVAQDAGPDATEEPLALLRQRIASVFETGRSYEYETTWPMPNGRRYYSVRLFPELDIGGAIVNVLGMSRDITERKLAEERLRLSESQFAEAQQLANVGSWNLDLRTMAVMWSEELYRMFGVRPEEFAHTFEAVLAFIHPDDRAFIRSVIDTATRTRESFSVYYRINRPDGGQRIVHVRGAVVADEHGDAIRMYGAAQDVTERKQAEERLRATTEQLRALSGRLQSVREEEGTRIARELHDDLGQRLTAIKLDTTALLRDLPADRDPGSQRSQSVLGLLDAAIQSIRRIATELRPGILDDLGLAAAVEWVAEEFEARTGTKVQVSLSGVEIDIDPEGATALFRILQETLTNVARHAGATRVKVSLAEHDGMLTLEVHDNGRGIAEAQLSASTSLGIVGMRERALLLGGELTIYPAAGGGTTVRVRVPRALRT